MIGTECPVLWVIYDSVFTATVSGSDLSRPDHQIYLIVTLGHWMDSKVYGESNKISESIYF